MNHIKKK